MGFLHPELLLLAAPALFVWWRHRGRPLGTAVARLAVLILLILALGGPYLSLASEGRDLVVVVDRSRSMLAGQSDADTVVSELMRLAEEARQPGDRIAVVSFGAEAAIESLPSESGKFDEFERGIDGDGSNLAEALETAASLIPDGRQGSLFLISDGEENSRSAIDAARRAFARGINIDVRAITRAPAPDLSVESLDLPGEVAAGEPFQFSAWVRSDARVEASFKLYRGAQLLSSGKRVFEPGPNRLFFRDIGGAPGIVDYRLVLDVPNDRTLENNRGLGAVRTTGARPILILNDDGTASALVEALQRSGIPVVVKRPEATQLTPVSLSAYRAVVLENVAARRVGKGLDALRDFVLERGGGLFITGGKASFGVGGYHLSPIDELLPVSMELRQEHRKLGVALVVVMDRSGSMAAPASGGTKMDLANLGAAAAIELLSAIDSIGVLAVDTAPHTVQSLTPVVDPGALTAQVRRTTSGGGGIYVFSGLLAAGRMLEKANQKNRHIILFSDAADSEEQGGVPQLMERFGEMGITVSVIALGTESDSDAEFLKRTAEQGGGEVYFTTRAEELPRLFSQDTLTVARSSFLEEPTTVQALPDLFALGELALENFPDLPAYNLNYMRPGAIAGAITTDEYRAPVFAFWHQGLGRVAAYTGQVGGEFGGPLVAWSEFSAFFVTIGRWLAGQEEVDSLFPSVRREGKSAIISVEVDPDAPVPPDTSHLFARLRQPNGDYEDVVLERIEEHRFEARVALNQEGIALGTVRVGDDRFVTLPPIALPYSPEFERSADPERGARLLRAIATESGGEVSPATHTLFRGPRQARGHRVIARELMLAALLVLLFEIVFRRLDLWSTIRVPASLRTRTKRLTAFLRQAREKAPPKPQRAPSARQGSESPSSRLAKPDRTTAATPAPPEKKGDIAGALEAARRNAGRKLDR